MYVKQFSFDHCYFEGRPIFTALDFFSLILVSLNFFHEIYIHIVYILN